MNRSIIALLVGSMLLSIPGCAAEASDDAAVEDDLSTAGKTNILKNIVVDAATPRDVARILPGTWTSIDSADTIKFGAAGVNGSLKAKWTVSVPNIVWMERTYGVGEVNRIHSPAFIAALRQLSKSSVESLGGTASETAYSLDIDVLVSVRKTNSGRFFALDVRSASVRNPAAFLLAIAKPEFYLDASNTFEHSELRCPVPTRVTLGGIVCDQPEEMVTVPGTGVVGLHVTADGGVNAGERRTGGGHYASKILP
jgi:hypothetical protein